MIKLKLTLKDYGSGHNTLIIYSSNVITFYRDSSNMHTIINESTHNNGGFRVMESVEEIEKMMDSQLK